MKNKSEYLQSWTSAKRAAARQNGAPVKKQGINVQNYANASSPYSEFQIEMPIPTLDHQKMAKHFYPTGN
jgi:hypothetical protein